MPDNSFISNIKSATPFTISTPNYEGVFTIGFDQTSAFRIYDSINADNLINLYNASTNLELTSA